MLDKHPFIIRSLPDCLIILFNHSIIYNQLNLISVHFKALL